MMTSEENIIRAIEAAASFEASNFSMSFRTRERGGKSHCVVQAQPEAFKALLSCRKIAIGWTRHSVKEHFQHQKMFQMPKFRPSAEGLQKKKFLLLLLRL
ncbi:hypothetical protein AVEN_111437-1 [Araneus ventricosus]|uniref:Uncharacterized protein n=1 Tax=Araneus ventricosus TaxID=182803 RepID=A0A4Y2K406_ARAVE|nr:hypothetical protein AVEN_111437-1 [Araneus ventricosus]